MYETILDGLVQAGWVIYPLIGASLIGWFMAFHRLLGLHVLEWRGYQGWSARLARDDWERAVEGLTRRERKTAAGQALAGIFGVRSLGREAMEAKLDEVMKFQIPELEKFLSTLAILASAAPLVGLLGTVAGIINTFKVISAFGTGNTALMSDSIAESLMATQNGLLVAFPLMLMQVYLSSKAEAIEKRALASAHALINRCAGGRHNGRVPQAGRAQPILPSPVLGLSP